MKKVLSVFLAVLMLFGALSVSSFAEETTAPVVTPPMAYHDWWGEGGPCSKEQAVLAFNLNGGSLKSETQIYNEETGQFEWTAPAFLFACLVFTLTAPTYVWTIIGV